MGRLSQEDGFEQSQSSSLKSAEQNAKPSILKSSLGRFRVVACCDCLGDLVGAGLYERIGFERLETLPLSDGDEWKWEEYVHRLEKKSIRDAAV